MTEEERYMGQAIRQAKKALLHEDVPIGCVIVYENRIIARGYNKRNKNKTTLAHAELDAIGMNPYDLVIYFWIRETPWSRESVRPEAGC